MGYFREWESQESSYCDRPLSHTMSIVCEQWTKALVRMETHYSSCEQGALTLHECDIGFLEIVRGNARMAKIVVLNANSAEAIIYKGGIISSAPVMSLNSTFYGDLPTELIPTKFEDAVANHGTTAVIAGAAIVSILLIIWAAKKNCTT